MKKYNGSFKPSFITLAVLFICFLGYLIFSPYSMLNEISTADNSKQEGAKQKTSLPVSAPSQKRNDEEEYSKKGVIHPLLHEQGLSHMIFHSSAFQELLASIVPAEYPRSVLVAGVEWGRDVKHFARLGYRVVAFEPMTSYYEKLESYFSSPRSIRDDGKPANVSLHNLAVGDQSGSLTVVYNHAKQSVPIVRVDDVVHEPISVLQADVQGNELAILRGASNLLKSSVQMVWVEAIACNEKLTDLLTLLDDENFIMFDFAPFGRPVDQDADAPLKERRNFIFNPARPSAFDEYLDWFCKKKVEYPFLQTDFVAVKRTLLSEAIPRLRTLGSDSCPPENDACVLRSHLQSTSSKLSVKQNKPIQIQPAQ